jgi:hypothetical protein
MRVVGSVAADIAGADGCGSGAPEQTPQATSWRGSRGRAVARPAELHFAAPLQWVVSRLGEREVTHER